MLELSLVLVALYWLVAEQPPSPMASHDQLVVWFDRYRNRYVFHKGQKAYNFHIFLHQAHKKLL